MPYSENMFSEIIARKPAPNQGGAKTLFLVTHPKKWT